MERKGKKERRREAATERMAVQQNFSSKSSSTRQGKQKRMRRGRALEVKVNDFPTFEAAVRAFNSMTVDIVRLTKERQYHRQPLTRHARKLKGKRLEKRNRLRGYSEIETQYGLN